MVCFLQRSYASLVKSVVVFHGSDPRSCSVECTVRDIGKEARLGPKNE